MCKGKLFACTFYISIFRKKYFDLLVPTQELNICLHVIVRFIPFDLISNMTTFKKKIFGSNPRVMGTFKNKSIVYTLLYVSFFLI